VSAGKWRRSGGRNAGKGENEDHTWKIGGRSEGRASARGASGRARAERVGERAICGGGALDQIETSRVSPMAFGWFLGASVRESTSFLHEEIVSSFCTLSLFIISYATSAKD
jgi:hypothetical protein